MRQSGQKSLKNGAKTSPNPVKKHGHFDANSCVEKLNAVEGNRNDMQTILSFFIPMFLIFVVFLLDNTIHGSDEVEQLSSIPILGLIGKYRYRNNLVVFEKPKSAVAESFRAIRSSLQFFYKNKLKGDEAGGKTMMITSSVSGEGKTFIAINLASVLALTNKKVLLIGADIRKPKLSEYLEINSEKGLTHFLMDSSLKPSDVIVPIAIAHLLRICFCDRFS